MTRMLLFDYAFDSLIETKPEIKKTRKTCRHGIHAETYSKPSQTSKLEIFAKS